MLSDFGNAAQRLTRNPLGIIALNVVLVYGIAGIAAATDKLQAFERLPLIWFLVLFPVVVLGVFYRLVTCHHHKLYAPGDWRDEERFLRAMTPEQQKQRLDAEVAEFRASGELIGGVAGSGTADTVLVRQNYVVAEELAFREIQREFRAPIRQHVAVGDSEFDGVLLRNGIPVAIEIKFTKGHNWTHFTEHALAVSRRARAALRSPELLLAVVADGLTMQQREAASAKLSEALLAAAVPVLLRVYDFKELRARYGL